MLRNPAARAQRFAADPADALDLPWGAPTRYRATPTFTRASGVTAQELVAGTAATFDLQPFEVRVLDLVPIR